MALEDDLVVKRGSSNEGLHFMTKNENSNRYLVGLCVLEKKIRNLS